MKMPYGLFHKTSYPLKNTSSLKVKKVIKKISFTIILLTLLVDYNIMIIREFTDWQLFKRFFLSSFYKSKF